MDHLDQIGAEWHAQRPDLDTEPLLIVGRLFRAVALAEPQLAARLGKFGLQPGWFNLLAALRRAGKPYELTPTQLMRAMMVSSAGVTKRLDRLEQSGLIERHADPSDRRGTLVRLTPTGKRAVDRAVEAHIANEAEILDALTAAEQRQLDHLLRKLLAGLE